MGFRLTAVSANQKAPFSNATCSRTGGALQCNVEDQTGVRLIWRFVGVTQIRSTLKRTRGGDANTLYSEENTPTF